MLETNDPATRGELSRHLQNFSDAYRGYDQVRLIDRQGMEVIRINLVDGKATPVAPENLQDKSGRPYFKQAMKLAPGEVYVSPMDLNIEHNRVEEPHKPVIRFAMPVFARDGSRLGVVVLNYLAAEMLGKFRETMARDLSHQGMLINPDGYWLSNHDRSNEWGFALDRPDLVFGALYPQAWAQIQTTKKGSLLTDGGLFVFESFSPLVFDDVPLPNAIPAATMEISRTLADGYHWTIVIFLPAEALASTALFNQPLVRGMLVATAILLALSQWLLISRNIEHHRNELRQRALQRNLNDLYENAPCGYLTLNSQGRILQVNTTALGWLGFTREEIIGKEFKSLMSKQDLQRIKPRIHQVFDSGIVSDETLSLASRDGSPMTVSFSAVAVEEPQKNRSERLWRCTLTDITERMVAQKNLEDQAHSDSLTGIHNRRFFSELAERELARAKRNRRPLSLLMIDLDHFKDVNDHFGHDTGDRLLQAVAKAAARSLRREDILARYGGEEFVVLLPESDEETALEIAERLRVALSEIDLETADNEHVRISVSIGVAELNTRDTTLDAIIKRADIALYEAKASGRNQVCAYARAVA